MDKYLLQHYLRESALQYPDECAVTDGVSSITYRELDEKSNQIAHILLRCGLVEGETVAVCLDRSVESVMAFFGICKARCAYIPQDTRLSPPGRIRQVLKTAACTFCVSNTAAWKKIMDETDTDSDWKKGSVRVLLLDTLHDGADRDHSRKELSSSGSGEIFFFDSDAEKNLPCQSDSLTKEHLAYILYTSGSTGVPKGVMITHQNAMTFVNWALSAFSLQAGTVFANHASFQFDLSVFDIYASIAAGGCLHIAPHACTGNPRMLLQWMETHRIEIWYSVPSVWIAVLNHAQIEPCMLKKLRIILFAGEIFPPVFLRKLMKALPQCAFYNLYGPTETNVCTFYNVLNPEEIGDAPVPIGKAINETSVIALDSEKREVPVGECGELHVAGAGVSPGYYKNETATAQSFLPNDLLPSRQSALYATGDIVRRISTESYTYCGRKDLMVKCAGYRIELQEIELVFYTHPSVLEAAAIVCWSDKRGTQILHAFVVLKNGMSSSVTELKTHLHQLLPVYMVPDVIHILREIPKNPNGKMDRLQLLSLCTPNNGRIV